MLLRNIQGLLQGFISILREVRGYKYFRWFKHGFLLVSFCSRLRALGLHLSSQSTLLREEHGALRALQHIPRHTSYNVFRDA